MKSRRKFLRDVAVGIGASIVLPMGRMVRGYQANEKVAYAVVGVGSRGSYLAATFARIGGRPVALCDANESKVLPLAKQWPDVKIYRDVRRMFDEREKEIDAVAVATADHAHAVVSAMAIRRGKHVYCEKPIAHDVREARTLRLLAAEHKVATQMGNQGMATDSFRRTLEAIEDGAVGTIREAYVWFVFGGSGPRQLPTDRPPVPPELDWDAWLGPAADRPYHPQYVFGWGGWWDFGTGCLGGAGSHALNLTFKALRLRELWEGPVSPEKRIRIESTIPEKAPHGFPRWQHVRFLIPPRGNLPPAVIYWYNASEQELRKQGIWARLEEIAQRDLVWKDGSWTPESGTLLVGEKGVVHTNAHNSVCQILPMEKFPDQVGPPRRYPHSPGHEREFIAACRGEATCFSNFDHSGPVIELLLAANVAGWFDDPLEFDPVECRIVNNSEADALLRPPYRSGWAL
jgi:hypothetical protein